tara:strand:- start:2108 stop:2509 length:402 start_codon:yes stop_codon:yes gene_type:complete
MIRTLIVMICVIALSSAALAKTGPNEKLDDPALEKRARTLYHEVRCPVCDSQSVADSDAEISGAIRAHIRTRLLEGDSDERILFDLRESYGDDITMTPPVNDATLMLWVMPFLILLIGGISAFAFIQRAGKET